MAEVEQLSKMMLLDGKRRRKRYNGQLQVGVILIGEGHLGSILHLLLILLKQGLVDGCSWGGEGGCGNEILL